MKKFQYLFLIICFSLNNLMGQQGLPVTPPKDNSNTEAERYEKEKQEWIKNNPDIYKKTSGQNIQKEQVPTPTAPKPKKNIVPTPKLSKEEWDKKDKEKEEWIKNNPEEYIKMGGTIPKEEVTKEVEVLEEIKENIIVEEKKLPKEEIPIIKSKEKIKDPIKIPSNAITWKLQKIEIIENGAIDEELDNIQQQFVSSASTSIIRIYIVDNEYVFIKGKNGTRKFSINMENDKMISKESNCENCKDIIFDILEFDNNRMIVEQEIESKGKNPFYSRYTFVPNQ